jgi:hypothetical protein
LSCRNKGKKKEFEGMGFRMKCGHIGMKILKKLENNL